MCPNCILNQAGLAPGVYVSFGVCFIFFVAAIFGIWWAFKNGEFEDMEGAKFDMLEDGEDTLLIQHAKKRVESTRQRMQTQE